MRVPPTEKYNRTQTSTITVAIIDPSIQFEFQLDRSQVDKKYVRSSGAGGQHINKTSSCCQLTHIPTGIQVKCMDSRDQKKNEEIAWIRLEEKLKSIEKEKFEQKIYQNRFDQVANSGRSDKKRSYRIKEDLVLDHVTGKKCTFKEFSRGRIELLS